MKRQWGSRRDTNHSYMIYDILSTLKVLTVTQEFSKNLRERFSVVGANILYARLAVCSNHRPFACSSSRPPEAEIIINILLVKQARHAVRVDTLIT